MGKLQLPTIEDNRVVTPSRWRFLFAKSLGLNDKDASWCDDNVVDIPFFVRLEVVKNMAVIQHQPVEHFAYETFTIKAKLIIGSLFQKANTFPSKIDNRRCHDETQNSDFD